MNEVMRSPILDEQCPSNDYIEGQPQGKCWGDGHYGCKNCIHYREDFKRLGQDFIDFVHTKNFITFKNYGLETKFG
jgi:hypothetical protein